jgi:hypothetical protein
VANSYKVIVKNPKEKSLLERPKSRREDHTEIDVIISVVRKWAEFLSLRIGISCKLS